MTEFKTLQKAMEENFKVISKDANFLYTLNLEKDELWNIYLDSFPKGTNEIYDKRREYDCSCCRHFINSFGDTVAIINNKIVSIWDFTINDPVFKVVVKVLSDYIKGKAIKDIFLSRTKTIGTEFNFGTNKKEQVIKWYHFNINLSSKFVAIDNDSIAQKKGMQRDIKAVFKRSLEEITPESVDIVLDLIAQKSLYKGDECNNPLLTFKKLQTEYNKLTDNEKEIYLWDKATNVGGVIGKIKNHSIGTLLINISKNLDLDLAVKKYESIVAPTNYKRTSAIVTPKMIEDAKAKVIELGFLDSLQRRFSILEDISINNVLFANRDVVPKLQNNDVFKDMKKEVALNPKSFDRVEEISIKDFIEKVLPTAKQIEVLVENKHAPNFVSLIAPFKIDSKTMFKWNNNFSWAYSGNITDSNMKHNVKSAGGNVEGVLRFSIQWNDEGVHNCSDYDAHCIEPSKNVIMFSNRNNYNTSGKLDVDIRNPVKGKPAVENITWSNKSKMGKGTYSFFVHNYNRRVGDSGFRAEIEFNGELYSFNYPKDLRLGEKIKVAEVIFDGENFVLKEILSSSASARDIWGIKSNNFVPVSVMMYSPNYWDNQNSMSNGNKHYFFMLKDCINNETPNGFFNEYLNNELLPHRKVFELLGSKMKVENKDNQLSGLGFSSTQRNSIVVRVEGTIKRILKIKF